ncbi:hypothetical protein BDK88_2409 [Natrinema hispanicum]|uniref:Uncharacterized protein n=1 Tax=Natrinema hispanicum TaxID=392421 RepID=A0A482YEK5_9EURY|nr:hypothetical protein BDK88_2409 [Natrinema hispanicum]
MWRAGSVECDTWCTLEKRRPCESPGRDWKLVVPDDPIDDAAGAPVTSIVVIAVRWEVRNVGHVSPPCGV